MSVAIDLARSRNKAACLLREFEGYRLIPYRCEAGYLTVGVGHRVELNAPALPVQVEQWLSEDIDVANAALIGLNLTVNQRAACISFVFNVGVNAFRQSTMRRLLLAGLYEAAAREFGRWVRVRVNGVLVESRGLVFRREAERDLFLCERD